jgi:hypothetical protein
MRFTLLAVIAFGVGLATPAVAVGQDTSATGAIATTTPGVDLSRLPINVGRIGRQLKQAEVREERQGLKLRYSIQVYGELPRIRLITPLDNILTGDVPKSAPTHTDMIQMMTPREFSAPVIGLGSIPRRK